MKFAEKCPKCGGFVQTKSVRKSIGLGFVEIPIAQFCLNPVCDWYQDFAEPRKPEEIKEGYHLKAPSFGKRKSQFNIPAPSRNHLIALGGIVAIIILYFLIPSLAPVSNAVNDTIKPTPASAASNNSITIPGAVSRFQETPVVTAVIPTPDRIGTKVEPKSYMVKMDVGHGFFPEPITINVSDTLVWRNEENMRTRIVFISKDGLFENQLLQYPGKYQYQFNISGKYTFALAENGTNREYPNATGTIIVR